MSESYKAGKVTMNPSTNLNTKTAVDVKFRNFEEAKFLKVFCQVGNQWKTRVQLASQNSDTFKEGVQFLDTPTHRCGWVYVDVNLWKTVTFFD